MGKYSDDVIYTPAQLKGRRVRMVRILSGLTRQELYGKIHLSPSTINTWETGRVELTEIGAGRVCEAFARIGILCSKEWLLSGIGAPPRIMSNLEKAIFSDVVTGLRDDVKKSLSTELDVPFDDIIVPDDIKKELSFFVELHPQALFHVVSENFMNSRYKIGDCVAGVISEPNDLINCTVIVEKIDFKKTLGKLISYQDGICEIFYGMKSTHEMVKANAVAEITWHRMISRKTQR